VSRIRRGYEDRFRALLRQARARRLEEGVQWLVAKAGKRGAHEATTTAVQLVIGPYNAKRSWNTAV